MTNKWAAGCGCCVDKCRKWIGCAKPKTLTISGADGTVTSIPAGSFGWGGSCTNMGDLNAVWPIEFGVACADAIEGPGCLINAGRGYGMNSFVYVQMAESATEYILFVNVRYNAYGLGVAYEEHQYEDRWVISSGCPVSGALTHVNTENVAGGTVIQPTSVPVVTLAV